MQNIVQLNVQKVKRCICFFFCIAYVTMLSSKVQYFLGNHLLVLCSSKVNLFFLQVQNRFLRTRNNFLPAPVKNVCSVRKHLTLSNCSQLRKYHAACMIKDLNNQDFPPTQNRMAEKLDREEKLKEAEDKRQSANVHCIAWKNKACIFQRVEGDTKTLHDNIKKYDWVKCADCLCWGHFECFGVQRELESMRMRASKLFSCGCTKASDPSLAQHISGDPVDSILTDDQIRTLDYGLKAGRIMSNRLFLQQHPGYDPSLQSLYLTHLSIFKDQKTDDLSNRLLTVLSVNPTDVKEVRYTLEVLLPEVISQWLRVQFGMNRYEAECVLLKKTVIPLPPEKKGQCQDKH
ncbi:unnamed protein product [Arctogadus glacialis]